MKSNIWAVLWLVSAFSLVTCDARNEKGLTKEQMRQIRSSELYHAKEARELKVYLMSHGLISPDEMKEKPSTHLSNELHDSSPKLAMGGEEGDKKKENTANQMPIQAEDSNVDNQLIEDGDPKTENQAKVNSKIDSKEEPSSTANNLMTIQTEDSDVDIQLKEGNSKTENQEKLDSGIDSKEQPSSITNQMPIQAENSNVDNQPKEDGNPKTENQAKSDRGIDTKEQPSPLNKQVQDSKPKEDFSSEGEAKPDDEVNSVKENKSEIEAKQEANKPAESYFDTPQPEHHSVKVPLENSGAPPIKQSTTNTQANDPLQESETYDTSKFVPYTAVKDKVIVGYYADWKARDMPPENIPFDKLTHINYAFAIIKDNDEPYLETEFLLPKVVELAHGKNVKVLLSVGGWTGSKNFSPIAADAGRRSTLVKKLVNIMTKFELDGIDIDWEFPGRMGLACNQINTAVDSTNFGLMLKELRDAMDSQFAAPDKRKQITLAVRVEPLDGPSGPLKDVSSIVSSIDFINVMAYDLNGPWGSVTGPNAPLRHRAGKGFQLSYMSGIQSWLAAKFPSDKLVMGLPFYGRSFQLNDDFKNFGSDAFYVPFSNVVPKGDQEDVMWSDPCPGAAYTYSGVWQWKNLRSQALLTSPLSSGKGWIRHYDSITHTPWLHNPESKTLINYDDPESLSHKVNLAKCFNLRGVMAWALHEDNLELLDSVQSIRSSKPSARNLCESYNQLDRMETRAAKLNRTVIDPYPFKRGSLGVMSGITRHAPAQRFRKLPIPDMVTAM